MSISNELYSNFKTVMEDQDKKSKEIRGKISNFQQEATKGTNTVSLESDIQKDIKNLRDKVSELENAYSNRNAPSQIPPNELDRRQKEIQKLNISVQDIDKTFKTIQSQKYAFKGQSGDYKPTEEMKGMSNAELIQLQKEKIDQQDKQIDDITMDVKKGRVLAKEAANQLEQQNKQLDQLQEDIDRLDSRFQRGVKRFENYVNKQSGCCIIICLVVELVIALLIYFLLG